MGGLMQRHCLQALGTKFQEFLASKGRDLLENLDTVEAVIHRAIITYGRLQSQDVQINPVQAVDDSLNLQQHESLVTESTTLEANLNSDVKALDAGSVITESSETKSDMHDTSNSSRTYITHVVDANIRPVNDQVPSAEVHLTVPHNVLATEQYQAKSPLLKAELVKSKEMIEKETYNELSRRKDSEFSYQKDCIHTSAVQGISNLDEHDFKDVLIKTVQPRSLNVKWRLLASLQALFH
ncbi:hypothetical protein Tco_0174744 [Tanacetum coccineum]